MITNNEFIYGTSNSNNYKKYYKFTKIKEFLSLLII